MSKNTHRGASGARPGSGTGAGGDSIDDLLHQMEKEKQRERQQSERGDVWGFLQSPTSGGRAPPPKSSPSLATAPPSSAASSNSGPTTPRTTSTSNASAKSSPAIKLDRVEPKSDQQQREWQRLLDQEQKRTEQRKASAPPAPAITIGDPHVPQSADPHAPAADSDAGALVAVESIVAIEAEEEERLRKKEAEEAEKPQLHREEDFVSLLMTLEGGQPSKELFNFLFELLAEYAWGIQTSTEGTASKQLDFFYIFFELLSKCPSRRDQIDLLQRLNEMSASYLRLKGYCCRRLWITRLLMMVPNILNPAVLDEILALVFTLGSFSFSIKDMMQLLRLLRTSMGERPRNWSQLLEVLNKTITTLKGPDVYFDFNGKNSMIILPQILRFPISHGYSFCTWLRIESFDDPFAEDQTRDTRRGGEYHPYLYSFLNHDGCGVEVYFVKGHLVVESVVSKSKRAVARFKFPFLSKIWYFVAITHLYHFVRTSDVALYVDGELKDRQPLIYPKIENGPLHKCYVGSNQHHQMLFGQLGQVIIFQEAIEPDDVRAMFQLGPNLAARLADAGGTAVVTGQQNGVFVFDSKRSAKLLLSYNPKVIHGHYCLDTCGVLPGVSTAAASEGGAGERTVAASLNARAVKSDGVISLKTFSMRDTLYCMGGLKVLFPLLSQLNRSFAAAEGSAAQATAKPEGGASPATPSSAASADASGDTTTAMAALRGTKEQIALTKLISILVNVVRDSPTNQELLLRTHGFPMLGHLFQKLLPCHWTTEAVAELDRLGAAIAAVYEPLFREFFLHIFFNFHIWILTDVAVQRALCGVILRNVRANATRFREWLGVQPFLDVLRSYYWYADPPVERRSDATVALERVVHPATGEVLGRHPDPAGVRLVRLELLQAVRALLEVKPNPAGGNAVSTVEAVRAVLVYVMECKECEQGADVLQLILALQSTGLVAVGERGMATLTSEMTQHLLELGGVLPFLALLRSRERDDLKFRVWTLKVFGKLLEQLSPKQRPRHVTRDRFVYLKHALAPFPFSEPVYTALLEILVENVSVHAGAHPFQKGKSDAAPGRALRLRNPDVLAAIFELACTCGDMGLQMKALADILVLLRQNPHNRQVFVRQPNWPTWLLGLLARAKKSSQPVDADDTAAVALPISADMAAPLGGPELAGTAKPKSTRSTAGEPRTVHFRGENELFDMVVEVFTLMFTHALRQRGGWHVFDEVLALLHHFGFLGYAFPGNVARAMNNYVINFIFDDAALLDAVQTQYVAWENVAKWVLFTESFVFVVPGMPGSGVPERSPPSDHFLLGIHRRVDRQWGDFRLAQKILDLIELLTVKHPPLPPNQSASGALPATVTAVMSPLGPTVTAAAGIDSTAAAAAGGMSTSTTGEAGNEGIEGDDVFAEFGIGKAGVSEQAPTVTFSEMFREVVQRLERMHQRLTLYLLHETDTFLHTDRMQSQRDQLKSVERMVDEQCPQVIGGRLAKTLTSFLQMRVQGWTRELAEVNRMFQQNAKRLMGVVDKLLENTGNFMANFLDTSFANWRAFQEEERRNRLLYIVAFLYKAMRRSFENRGVGTEPIYQLFREVVEKMRRRGKFPLPESVGDVSNDQLVELILSGLSLKSKPGASLPLATVELLSRFDEATKFVLEEEARFCENLCTLIARSRTAVRDRMEAAVRDELAVVARLDDEISSKFQPLSNREAERRRLLGLAEANRRRVAAKLWRKCHRELSALFSHSLNPNAPAAGGGEESGSEKKLLWKLEPTEDLQRRRMKLKRDYHGTDHPGCEKSTARTAEASSGAGAAAAASAADEAVRDAISKKGKQPSAADDSASEGTDVDSSDTSSTASADAAGSANAATAASTPSTPALADADDADVDTGDASTMLQWLEEETKVFAAPCEMVTAEGATPGIFELTSRHVFFIAYRTFEDDDAEGGGLIGNAASEAAKRAQKKDRRWDLAEICKIFSRRYLLQDTAIELFLLRRRTIFFNFTDKQTRNNAYRALTGGSAAGGSGHSVKLPSLKEAFCGPASKLMEKKRSLTEAWRRRQLSNFDYLMELNTIAGRTYNDLAQYFVFPWILSNYSSESLDLSDPRNFRDLSKPMGAQDPNRLRGFLERYAMFDDPVIPKFHYGTHYSHAGGVLYYLVRLEPFTSIFLEMQGGRFDHADRMFGSVAQAWDNCLHNAADVKELIPEFFYLPELFVNNNRVSFGVRNDQTRFDDAGLPPWANGSPELFVKMHRDALESEYVSAHLHEWIDLIFGFKQRGERAIEAHNVFYYLTYEGAVDLNDITDPHQRAAVISQIRNFGQTPAQLFPNKPHPKRMSLDELATPAGLGVALPVASAGSLLWRRSLTKKLNDAAFRVYGYTLATDVKSPIIFLSRYGKDDNFVAVYRDGRVATNSFSFSASSMPHTPHYINFADEANPFNVATRSNNLSASTGSTVAALVAEEALPPTMASPTTKEAVPFSVDFDKTLNKPSQRVVDTLFTQEVIAHCVLGNEFALSADGKLLVMGGKWDNTFKLSLLSNSKPFLSISKHKDVVTCVALSRDATTLVTGSADATLLVWDLAKFGSGLFSGKIKWRKGTGADGPSHMLVGHEERVTCVAIDTDLDIVVSGSSDGRVNGYSLLDASFGEGRLRWQLPHPGAVRLVAISRQGDIVACCEAPPGGGPGYAYLYTINGKFIKRRSFKAIGKVHDVKVTSDSRWLVAAGERGIGMFDLYTLKLTARFETPAAATALVLVGNDTHVIAGLEDGRITVIPLATEVVLARLKDTAGDGAGGAIPAVRLSKSTSVSNLSPMRTASSGSLGDKSPR